MAKKFLISTLSFLLIFAFGTVLVFAQPTGGGNPPTGGGNPPVGGGNPTCNGTICIPNPFKVGDNLFQLVENVIKDIILPIGAVLAVLAFIYSGFLYVTAQGNETKIKTAHNALLYSAVGTALLLGAWTFANVIQNTIEKITK